MYTNRHRNRTSQIMARRRFSPFMLLSTAFYLGLLLSSAIANQRHLKGQAVERNKRTRTAVTANTANTNVTAPTSTNTTATNNVTPPNNNNTTTISEGSPSVIVTNSTLPQECMPISTECMDRLRPLAKTAHNSTAGSEEKNTALYDYCASDCGTNYTNHVTAILQGKCIGGLPPRTSGSYSSNEYGGTGVTVVVKTPRSPGGPNVQVSSNTAVNRPGRPSDDSNTTIYKGDADDHDDDDDDDDDDSNLTEQEIMDRFEQDRPGTALGCVKAHDGQYCAEKSGCDFWNSCCYSSWARLGGVAGYPLSARTVRAVEFFCPGSTRYVDVDGCT